MTRVFAPGRSALRLAMALGLLTTAPDALAQVYDSAARIDQLQPASAGSPFPRAEGPRPMFEQGAGVATRILGEYMLDPLKAAVVGGDGTETPISLVRHAALVHVGGHYSPRRWLNLEFNIPFAVYEQGDASAAVKGEGLAGGTTGVGDVRVGVHALPLQTRKLSVQLGARFWGPTGTEAAYLQSSRRLFRTELVAAAMGETESFLYGCTLGLAPMWFAGRDGDRLAATCAAGVKLGDVAQLALEPHFAAFAYRTHPDQATLAGLGDTRIAVAFEPLASLSFKAGDFALALAGGAGLGDAPGTAAARGMLSLTYATVGHASGRATGDGDRDLDGTSDTYDACPDEAGPEERRGCPDKRDEDGDGIVAGDACPTQPGSRSDDPKASGCPDRDNDRIADPIDRCPTEPGDGAGGCPRFARLDGKTFRVTPPLAFANGLEKLAPNGVAALIEIVRTLRVNLNLRHVAIKLGTRGATARLTDARAGAILAILNEQNFESNRYELVLDDARANGAIEVVGTR
ncbi:MAG: hypothetical protein FJ096_04530 [Deltaproteobacteria bacterium]|nr:hypothetical protein [Deltaproteobacteria bacterium]